MKYREWLNHWLEYYVRPVVKTRTYEKYKGHVNNYIVPKLGDFDMEELLPVTLQKFTTFLMSKNLSPNSINGILSVIKSSLKNAVAVRIVKEEWSCVIVRPKSREKKVDCFSKEEQRKIERFILDSRKANLFGIILALYTGMRIGELLALTWKDIDFNKGLISVDKTCYDGWQNGKYKKIINSAKTESSVRLIPLPRQLRPFLRQIKNCTDGNYVIGGRTEFGAEVRTYQRRFERMLAKLGISHKGFHALRHTFATRALEVGVDIKTLSEVLGHSSPTVTLNRYAHSMLEHKCEMMDKVGKLLIKIY